MGPMNCWVWSVPVEGTRRIHLPLVQSQHDTVPDIDHIHAWHVWIYIHLQIYAYLHQIPQNISGHHIVNMSARTHDSISHCHRSLHRNLAVTEERSFCVLQRPAIHATSSSREIIIRRRRNLHEITILQMNKWSCLSLIMCDFCCRLRCLPIPSCRTAKRICHTNFYTGFTESWIESSAKIHTSLGRTKKRTPILGAPNSGKIGSIVTQINIVNGYSWENTEHHYLCYIAKSASSRMYRSDWFSKRSVCTAQFWSSYIKKGLYAIIHTHRAIAYLFIFDNK